MTLCPVPTRYMCRNWSKCRTSRFRACCASGLSVGAEATAPDGRPSRIHVENTWNTEILPELAPLSMDPVIVKRRWSAFFDTELDAQLCRLDARYSIITGCTTSMCIESTIRDAAFRDYVCLLPADCTGQPARRDSSYSGHEASLVQYLAPRKGEKLRR
jgi:ureidoacrylate peracid hydrolase